MVLTLFFKDTTTTRDVNKAQIYAWRKGVKPLLHPPASDGSERIQGCVFLRAVI